MFEHLQQSGWWNQFISLQNTRVEAGHCMQGTHAGVNAYLRLQRAWSNGSAEGDPGHLSPESSDDSGSSIIRYFIAEPAKGNGLGQSTKVDSRGLYKQFTSQLPAGREDVAVPWQQKVPAACWISTGVPVAMPHLLTREKPVGRYFHANVACHCKMVCVTLFWIFWAILISW